jgi:hypothetical protein
MMHVSWTTLREQIFAKLKRPYRSEANMNEVGHVIRDESLINQGSRETQPGLLCCLCPSSTCHLVYFFSTFGMAIT